MKRLLLVIALFTSTVFGQANSKPSADLILTNANIHTVDNNRPQAEAVAVIGDRIVAVGSKDEIDQWRGSATKVIDAQGKLVLPGFNDAHVHLIEGSATLTNVKLKDADSPEEFARRLGEYARKLPKGEWITGGDWDDQAFKTPQLPTRQMIDAATPDNPVFVNRYDGHMSLANSLALRLAGVTAATKEVPGGKIVRDGKGQPTGVLKDAAMGYVYKVVPGQSLEKRIRTLKQGLPYIASVGVTSVQNMSAEYGDIAAYSTLAEKGELTLRVYAAPSETAWNDQAKLGLRHAFGSSMLRLGAVKGYADGSLGSTTAYFFAAYNDDPKTAGLLSDEMQPLSAIRDRLTKADAAGLQLCMHAIGDRGISIMLDLFADVVKTNGERDRRLRIEHAQHLAPKDFARFAQMNVIASVQPYHAIDDGRWADKRIGAERSKTTYAFRTFLDNHVRLALGTDWFVAPLNPLETIYAAVTRATLDGKNPNGWVPEQKITVAEAVEAYTLGSAYAEFQEKEKGTITPGKLADIVILSDDIFTIRKEAIREVKVEKTILGGKVIYERTAN
ncbi:MAG TPA: amidohydrolase [Terriglobales bacterium]|nr:amidohydrolase [Terriglobales bacterium]